MADPNIFSEALRAITEFRDLGSDQLGPLAPLVTGISWVVTGGLAAFMFVLGKSFGAPPPILGFPGFSTYAARIFGTAAGVGLVILYVWSKSGATALSFTIIAMWSIVIGFTGLIVYLILYSALFFRCEQDPDLYIKGLRLQPEAKRVLNKKDDLAGLDKERAKVFEDGARPKSAGNYFCRSGKDFDFIWGPGSQGLSVVLLYFVYFFMIVPSRWGSPPRLSHFRSRS